jgi:hypothetical protein
LRRRPRYLRQLPRCPHQQRRSGGGNTATLDAEPRLASAGPNKRVGGKTPTIVGVKRVGGETSTARSVSCAACRRPQAPLCRLTATTWEQCRAPPSCLRHCPECVCVCVSSQRAAQPTQHPGGLAPFFLCAGRTRGKKGFGTGFCLSKLPYMCTARHTCRFWWCAIVSRSASPDLYHCKKKGEGQGRKSNRESTPTCISPDTQPYTPPPLLGSE